MAAQLNYRPFGAYRALLAGLVLIQHIGWTGPPDARWGSWGSGSMAVLAFFALSGFVMTEAAVRFYQGRAAPFAINRALRIIPLYLVALALGALSVWLAFPAVADGLHSPLEADLGAALQPANLALNLIRVLPAAPDAIDLVPYAWALRAEVAFYILLGVVLVAPSAIRLGAAWLVALTAGGLFAGALLGAAPPMFVHVPFFAFGVVAYFAMTSSGQRWWWAAASLLLACLVVFPRTGGGHDVPHRLLPLAVAFLAALLVFPLAIGRLNISAGLAALDRRLGDLSYPLYLLQFPVIFLASVYLPRGNVTVAFVAVSSVALAWYLGDAVDGAVSGIRDRVRGSALRAGGPTLSRPASSGSSPVATPDRLRAKT